MSLSPPPEVTHPSEKQVPGGWPEAPAETQSEMQFNNHRRPPSSEASHPLEQQVPGGRAEQLTEARSGTPEPQTPFNLRTELKRGRGGYRRHRGRGRYQPRNPNYRLSREELRDVAVSTLETIDEGHYMPPHAEDPYDLIAKVHFTNDNTAYYAPDDPDIENWTNADLGESATSGSENRTKIVIREYSTLIGTRRLHRLVNLRTDFENKTVGVLNFASAKKPGGGFLNGSQAQEESIARSSTLYPSLIAPIGIQFYEHYSNDPQNPFYTHAMLYSPSVVIFRNDKGGWTKPIEVDVLTSAAVNAGEVREQVHQEEEMRLLRERVRVAEEHRRRAREGRRLREEELKRDEEELRRAESTKQLLGGESTEGPDKKSAEEESEDTGNQKTDTTVETPLNTVEKEMDTADIRNEDIGVETPIVIEDKPEEKDASTIEAAREEAEPSTPTQDVEADSHPLENAEQQQQMEIQPVPSEPESPEPAQDPYYLAEVQIDVQMYERIARILYLFHKRGAKHLILGSFGTGVFQNRIELVAGIFYDLLAKPDAKFKNIFDTVVFAILGGPTIKVFREIFGDSVVDKIDGEDEVEEERSEVEGMRDVESEADLQVQGAGGKPAEHQMDGKSTEEPQDALSNGAQEPTADLQDVEMFDLTQKPAGAGEPDLGNIASQTAQVEQGLPAPDEKQAQPAIDDPQAQPVADDAQAHPASD